MHEWQGLEKKKKRKRPRDERTIGPIPITSKREHEIYKQIEYKPRPVSPATDIIVNIGNKRPKQVPKIEQELEQPKGIPHNSRPRVIDLLTDSAIS